MRWCLRGAPRCCGDMQALSSQKDYHSYYPQQQQQQQLHRHRQRKQWKTWQLREQQQQQFQTHHLLLRLYRQAAKAKREEVDADGVSLVPRPVGNAAMGRALRTLRVAHLHRAIVGSPLHPNPLTAVWPRTSLARDA